MPAQGPWLWEKGLGPQVEVEPILPDEVLPGGLVALADGRGGIERPIYLPEQGAIVFADGMTAPKSAGGLLRIWWTPVIEKRAKPALRAMLDLPFERVIVSHGEPVHTRDAFKRALELPQWPAGPLHQAAYRGNLDRVRSLVEAGADVTARDERFGATALDWAGWTKQNA